MRILSILALALFLAVPAQAAFTGPGAGGASTTVQAIKSMRDDSHVVLTGHIVSRIGGEKYVFKDSTGEITVEIDDKYFYGRDISPNDTVRIMGEVDKDFGRAPEIDVKSLEIVK